MADVLSTVLLAALISESVISVRYAIFMWICRSAGGLCSEELSRDCLEQFCRAVYNPLHETDLEGFTFLLQQAGK